MPDFLNILSEIKSNTQKDLSVLAETTTPSKALTRDELIALIKALKTNTSITYIHMHHQGLGLAGAKALADILLTNTSITLINFKNSKFLSDGVRFLAGALQINRSVQSIDLYWNDMGDTGAQTLADALKENTSIRYIGIGYNQIGPDGARALAQTLETNTSLHGIDLSENPIGDEGVIALASALAKNTSLRWITLSKNRISDVGVRALASALARNTSLQSIHLEDVGIGEMGLKALFDSFKTNTSLKMMKLGYLNADKYLNCLDALISCLEHNYVIYDMSTIYTDREPAKQSTIQNLLSRNHEIQKCFAFLSQSENEWAAIYQRDNIFNAIGVLEKQVPELKNPDNALPTYITERYRILKALESFVERDYTSALSFLILPFNDERLKPLIESFHAKILNAQSCNDLVASENGMFAVAAAVVTDSGTKTPDPESEQISKGPR